MELLIENLKVSIEEYNFKYDNLKISGHEAVAILGPSGSGKTTLLNAIAGLIPIKSGKITLNGRDITYLPPYERHIAYVFQDYALFDTLTVYSNVAFPLKVRHYKKREIENRVRELLEVVELNGFEKRIVSTLSGGEKQRIAIARALASTPELLLLDEPLSALDVSLRDKMRQFLKDIQVKTNIMTLLVTHDKKDADVISNRIVNLDKPN